MDDLGTLWETVWDKLTAGERPQTMRWPVLATVGLGGGAEARMVVLRHADRAGRHFDLHSDQAATKVAELEADPLATLVFWDPGASLQIRTRVRVSVRTGAAARAGWEAAGAAERASYGTRPPTGAPIPAPDAVETAPTLDRFAVLRAQLTSLDVLHLHPDGHRRAIFRRDDDFAGSWLAP